MKRDQVVDVVIKPELEEDLNTSVTDVVASHFCDLCDTNYANSSNLKRHKSTQHAASK